LPDRNIWLAHKNKNGFDHSVQNHFHVINTKGQNSFIIDLYTGWKINLIPGVIRASSSASAADDITALIIVAMVRISPLLGGNLLSLDRKKCPPTWLRNFFLLQYPASLCTARIIFSLCKQVPLHPAWHNNPTVVLLLLSFSPFNLLAWWQLH
jgi:hypothetical protein